VAGVCGTLLLIVGGFVCGGSGRAEARDVVTPPVPRVAKTESFADAAREEPEAPDIRAVVVSNSEAFTASSSVITFRIRIANQPALTPDMRIAVWVDADDDRTTGLAEDGALPGADYLVRWDRALREGASVLHCATSACRVARATSFRFSYADGATFSLTAAELGETRRFRFAALASSGAHADFAPVEGASWGYRLLVRKPAVPRGGRTLTVHLTVTRADGSTLTSGRVSCTAMVGGRRVAPRSARFVNGRATSVFVLPLSAVGTMIRGTITVVSGSTRVTQAFRRLVR
jgi:hypothetical protein